MVQNSLRHPRRRWNVASLALVALLVSLSMAACSSLGDVPPTATGTITPVPTNPLPTATFAPAATETPAGPSGQASTAAATETPPPTEAIPIDPNALAAEIAGLVAGVDGLVEVVVARPDGTNLAEINSYEQMEAASLYKLAIMVEVYVEREMGELSFDEEIVLDPSYFSEDDSVFTEGDMGYAVTIETLLQTMITLSSNVAATALLARVGNENVNLTMASLGLSSTEIRWSPGYVPSIPSSDDEDPPAGDEPDVEDPADEPADEELPTEEPDPADEEGSSQTGRALLELPDRRLLLDPRADDALNVTTAADIAALYVMLVNGQIVSESVSEEMLQLLEGQQINDRLPAHLPEDTVVAHKTGNLDGLVHDAGVIFAPAGPVVVVVLTEDVEEWQAIELIANIARLAYDTGS